MDKTDIALVILTGILMFAICVVPVLFIILFN